ncbi:MAG: SUMF1/EgtB/PvdO family nonheme iron enzyme [Gammaproteobacteria bacterium]|nr:SUMF1/EgtB/PvdO family nonheme iron enzyme [Gammaproteobacteria bacterium]
MNERRVVRGGSWNNTQGNARLGYRNNNDPDKRNNNLGFRVCRASHIFSRLLMAVCVVCGRRVQGVARFPCASKITTWPRLGVAAQSV